MPGSSIAANAVTTAASAAKEGVTQAVISNAPGSLIQAYNRLFHGSTTLNNNEDMAAFDLIKGELKAICNPDGQSEIPPNVIECWGVFDFDASEGPVYTFKNIPDLKQLKDYYATHTPIQGRVRYGFPLTADVLGILSVIKLAQRDATQSIPKIVLGYIGMVAIALTEIDDAAQQFETVELLKEVGNKIISNDLYLKKLGDEALTGLKELNSLFEDFTSTPHPKKDIMTIPLAAKRFQKHQLEIAKNLLHALLALTEGGNKENLTISLNRIQKGFLSDGDESTTFTKSNPFQGFLRLAASSLTSLHTQYSRNPIAKHIAIPSKEKIGEYLRECIGRGVTHGGIRAFRGNDPVLYLLEQKPSRDGSSEMVWATSSDEGVIEASANHIYSLANWLRFHLYVADKIVDINTVISIEGQSWLIQGEDADFIRAIMRNYKVLLDKFQEEMRVVNQSLSCATSSELGGNHGVIAALTSGLNTNVGSLREHGLEPLLNTDQTRFAEITDTVRRIKRFIFGEAAMFLNNSGYGFAIEFNHDSETRPQRAAAITAATTSVTSAPVAAATTATAPSSAPDISSDTISRVRWLLMQYASSHQYIVVNNGIESFKTDLREDFDRARAKWIGEMVAFIDSASNNTTKAFEILKRVHQLQHSDEWKHFINRRPGKTNIQKCIDEITKIIYSANAQEAVHPHHADIQQLTAGTTSVEMQEMPTSAPTAHPKPHTQNPTGFSRHSVAGDGDCGYTSLGIERSYAHTLLKDNCAAIAEIIRPAIKEALLTDKFYTYLASKGLITISIEQLASDDNLTKYSADLAICSAYLDFDVKEKQIEGGWAHPCVLRALAFIQKIELYIWRQTSANHRLIEPHKNSHVDFAHFKPEDATQTTHLLFVNSIHFERIEPTPAGDYPDYWVAQDAAQEGEGAVESASAAPHNPDETQGAMVRSVAPHRSFVHYLQEAITRLASSDASANDRNMLLHALSQMVGLNGRRSGLARLHAKEIRAWRHAHAKEITAKELHELISAQNPQAQKLLLQIHPANSTMKKEEKMPASLVGYQYLWVGSDTQGELFFVYNNTAFKTGIHDFSLISGFIGQPFSAQDITQVIAANNGIHPILAVVNQDEKFQQAVQMAFGAYKSAKDGLLTSFFGDSWLMSQASGSYKRLSESIDRVLEFLRKQNFSVDINHKEFLNQVAKHMLLDVENSNLQRDPDFIQDSALLDRLLKNMMDEFSKIALKSTPEEIARRDFYQEVIRHLLTLGASPIAWMRAQQEKSNDPQVEASVTRGHMLCCQQAQLILSHLEHRARHLGKTVLLLGDKFTALTESLEEFALHLFESAPDEGESVWDNLIAFFKDELPDGARPQRIALFWHMLEILYTMLHEGLNLNEPDSTASFTKFQQQQEKFKKAAQEYILTVRPGLFGSKLHTRTVNLPAQGRRDTYKDSYILLNTISGYSLHYIDGNGKDSIIELTKPNDIAKAIPETQGQEHGDRTLTLNGRQLREIIAAGGGELPPFVIDERVLSGILPPMIAHRNFGRRSFVNLVRAYFAIEGEFERLAAVHHHGKNILGVIDRNLELERKSLEDGRAREEAEKLAANERREKEQERREKEQERREKEQERREKEAADARAQDADARAQEAINATIATLAAATMPEETFDGLSTNESQAKFNELLDTVIKKLKKRLKGETEQGIKAKIIEQIKSDDELAHLKEFIMAPTSLSQNPASMFSPPGTPSAAGHDDLSAPLLPHGSA